MISVKRPLVTARLTRSRHQISVLQSSPLQRQGPRAPQNMISLKTAERSGATTAASCVCFLGGCQCSCQQCVVGCCSCRLWLHTQRQHSNVLQTVCSHLLRQLRIRRAPQLRVEHRQDSAI